MKKMFVIGIIFLSLMTLQEYGNYKYELKINQQNETQKLINKNEYVGTETYEIKFNDTLLGIACKYCPKNADIYEYVRDIKELNNISDTIYVGSEIQVYTFE